MIFRHVFLFYDTETTSRYPTEDDVISLGGVLAEYTEKKCWNKLDTFHTYVNTDRPIASQAQLVHHISKKDICNAPRFPKAMTLFETWIRETLKSSSKKSIKLYLVAHNGSKFDDIILYCNSKRYNVDFDRFLRQIHCTGFIDTIKMLKAELKQACNKILCPVNPKTNRQSFALNNCHLKFCNTEISNAHNALADSEALFNICTSKCLANVLTLPVMYKHVQDLEKTMKSLVDRAGLLYKYNKFQVPTKKKPRRVSKKRKRPRTAEKRPALKKPKAEVDEQRTQMCPTCFNWVNENHSCSVKEKQQ